MNRFSMPPFKLATNVWSAKDAPLQIQSFYAIKKVANLRGGAGSKKTSYRVLSTKTVVTGSK